MGVPDSSQQIPTPPPKSDTEVRIVSEVGGGKASPSVIQGQHHFIPRRGEEAAGAARRQKFYAGGAPTNGSLSDNDNECYEGASPESDTVSDQSSSMGGKHSTASGSIELKASWFNFAAPPKTPIGRKIEFSKLGMPRAL